MTTAQTVNFSAGERLIRRIPLEKITTTHNPRCPVPDLAAGLDFDPTDGQARLDFIRKALSDDEAVRKEFIDAIEQYEGGPEGIVELAASRRVEEIEPILLRSFRIKAPTETDPSNYEERYGLVVGERRLFAAAYNHAKYRLPANIGADTKRLTVDAAYDLAVAENLHRKDMKAIEVGQVVRLYKDRTNPATGRKYTMKQVAEKLNIDPQIARNRWNLSFLTPDYVKKLNDGKLGLTEASRVGDCLRRNKPVEEVSEKKTKRVRVMTLADVRMLFDTTPRVKRGFLEGLAAIMLHADGTPYTYAEAVKESDERLAEQAEAA